MKDAENKDISQVDIPLYIKSISEIKDLLKNRDILKISKGIGSLDYWTNEVEIATKAMALCSQEVANKIATETASGLEQYNLTESYEYSQILHVLTQINHKYPAKVLPYCLKQINIITKTPQFFIYTHEAEAYNLLAVNQMKLKDYKHAEVNYKNALKYLLERDLHYSNSAGYKNLLATIYHNIGRNYYFLQDYQNSIEYLTKSVSIQMELNGSVWPKTERYLYEAKSSLM
jgi:tetratricopeptide (TPR) repeat protein